MIDRIPARLIRKYNNDYEFNQIVNSFLQLIKIRNYKRADFEEIIFMAEELYREELEGTALKRSNLENE